jgi:periplasmic protein TonB
MKSGTCLAAICGTVVLHALAAVLAIRLLTQPSALPPQPEPHLIQAHLAPRALPVAPITPPVPAPAATPEMLHKPAARPARPPIAPRLAAKANPVPATVPLPATAAETLPTPVVNPVAPVAASPAPQSAMPSPAAPVRAGPSIPASYAASNRKPDYPLIARRYGEQGTVMLSVYVRADGSAGDVQIKTSSGHELLDESAKTAVQGWRFNPATIDGKPIAQWYQIPIPFTLSNSLHN